MFSGAALSRINEGYPVPLNSVLKGALRIQNLEPPSFAVSACGGMDYAVYLLKKAVEASP